MGESGSSAATASGSVDSSPSTPRTCVGCREVADRTALLRVVAVTGEDGRALVVPDPRKRMAGRGAWLHPDIACLDLAVRRKAFGRAFRAEVLPDVDELRTWVSSHHTPEQER